MSYTLIIIIITAITSIIAFNNQEMMRQLILYPRAMNEPVSYYRLVTSDFIHADWMHLFFNMFTLYFFGDAVEQYYRVSGLADFMFPAMYVAGIVVASLPSFIKNRNNDFYRSLGASGGVAAVLFAFIYFSPWALIYVYFIPVPAIVFAVLYLVYSAYMGKRGGDHINHDAHIYGAIFGFLFTLIFIADHGVIFLESLMHPSFF